MEPSHLKAHEQDYKPQAWEQYSMQELGNWVHLLSTRAVHRSDTAKMKKDLYDARNYLAMMQAKLDNLTDALLLNADVLESVTLESIK